MLSELNQLLNPQEFITSSLQPVFTEEMEIEPQVTRAEPWELFNLGYIIHPSSNLHVQQAIYSCPRVLSICAGKYFIFSNMLTITSVLTKVLTA